jgi:hypothetical protein
MTNTLKEKITNILQKSNVQFRIQPSIEGIRPDFLIDIPNHSPILIEAKSFTPKVFGMSQAIRHANLYKKITNVDQSLVVTDNLKHSDFSNGILSVNDLSNALPKLVEKGKQKKESKLPQILNTKKTIMAAMPFADKYDDTFVAMANAAKSVTAVCVKANQGYFTGDIINKIKTDIMNSVAVISDLSESRPNVLYETGFAHALGKPTVHICSTPLDELPFDVQTWNTIPYSIGQTSTLKNKLSAALKSVI